MDNERKIHREEFLPYLENKLNQEKTNDKEESIKIKNFLDQINARKNVDPKDKEIKIIEPPVCDINNISECKNPENGSLFIEMYKKEKVIDELQKIGLTIIQKNQMAVLLLAGGLGSRFNLCEPKVLLPITPLINKSFLQFFFEQIQFLENYSSDLKDPQSKETNDQENPSEKNQEEYKIKSQNTIIHVYIMTSNHTYNKIKTYLENRNYLGLKKEQIFIFQQNDHYVTDLKGNILFRHPNKFLKTPTGNGDLFRAIDENSVLQDMIMKNIKYVQVVSIDNILTRIADPVLAGFASYFKCDIANKFVKRKEKEAMGVFCFKKRKQKEQSTWNKNPLVICEYTELSSDILQNPNLFQYGNICHHIFSVDFLQNVISNKLYLQLKLHQFSRTKEYYDAENKIYVKSEENQPNVYCYEYFIFDIFKFAKRILSFEVLREKEFHPLKSSNTKGSTISDIRKSLSNLHISWLKNKNYKIIYNKNEDQNMCEISPLISYDGSYFVRLPEQSEIHLPYSIDQPISVSYS